MRLIELADFLGEFNLEHPDYCLRGVVKSASQISIELDGLIIVKPTALVHIQELGFARIRERAETLIRHLDQHMAGGL